MGTLRRFVLVTLGFAFTFGFCSIGLAQQPTATATPAYDSFPEQAPPNWNQEAWNRLRESCVAIFGEIARRQHLSPEQLKNTPPLSDAQMNTLEGCKKYVSGPPSNLVPGTPSPQSGPPSPPLPQILPTRLMTRALLRFARSASPRASSSPTVLVHFSIHSASGRANRYFGLARSS